MTKGQAIQKFWESFNIPAYDETTVPDDAPFPYITYQVHLSSLDGLCITNASIWYRSYSWKEISEKTEEISKAIAQMNPPSVKIDGGRMFITKGVPFAQRMREESDDTIRRMLLNVNYEFLTEY